MRLLPMTGPIHPAEEQAAGAELRANGCGLAEKLLGGLARVVEYVAGVFQIAVALVPPKSGASAMRAPAADLP